MRVGEVIERAALVVLAPFPPVADPLEQSVDFLLRQPFRPAHGHFSPHRFRPMYCARVEYARAGPARRSRSGSGRDNVLDRGTKRRRVARRPTGADSTHCDCAKEQPMSDQESSREQRKPNRLINEQSPYLRQHAYNPVDWYPWGEEALARAKAQNKPILLSIGYSACHWCHVMERESFEDPE